MIISVLTDVLKTKQSHHKGKKRNLKDADIEIEAERTNTVDQLLIKVIPSETHVVIYCATLLRLLPQVFWSGTLLNVMEQGSNKRISQIVK